MKTISIERAARPRTNATAPIVFAGAVAAAVLAACGGGSDDDSASRAQPQRANEPVVIGSHGPNPVSVWS